LIHDYPCDRQILRVNTWIFVLYFHRVLKDICSKPFDQNSVYNLALFVQEKIQNKTGPEGNKKQWLAWLIDYNKFKSAPADVDAAVLQTYAGSYGPAQILFEKGRLWVIQPGRTEKKPLLAMTEDMFIIDGEPDFHIKFEKNEQGEVIAGLDLFFDGSSHRIPWKK
jgi:hypothetical protein